MSVVVRMEMPKNCINCDLRYECNAFYAPGKSKPFMRGCMIVCQLPEGHGRLVDADTLLRDVEQYHVSDGKFQHWLELQHTIVPAERSET